MDKIIVDGKMIFKRLINLIKALDKNHNDLEENGVQVLQLIDAACEIETLILELFGAPEEGNISRDVLHELLYNCVSDQALVEESYIAFMSCLDVLGLNNAAPISG